MDAVKQCKVLVVVRKPDKPLNIQLYFTMLLHESTHDLSARLSVIVSALVGNRSFAKSLAYLGFSFEQRICSFEFATQLV